MNLWKKWRRRIAGKKLAKVINNYDAGFDDGEKSGYEKGRLSFSRTVIQVTSLVMRVDRLDKQVTELRTKGAGAEYEKLAQQD